MHLRGETYQSPATGRAIHRQVFLPEGKDRCGHVILLHGLGDHLGCHLRAAELFCDRGYVAVGIDWPGHGRSEGKRGHINGLGETFSLLEETLDWIAHDSPSPGGRTGVYAHSTGAFSLLHFLARRHRAATGQGQVRDSTLFDWVWLSSPLLRPDHGQPPLLVFAGRWLAKLAPSLTLDTKVRPDRCRHPRPDDAVAASREMDGCHHWVNAAFGGDLVKYARHINDTGLALAAPTSVLLTQGADDPICPPPFSRALFEKIATQEKRYLLLPGLRHEILREPGNDSAISRIAGWLDEVAVC